MGAEGWSIKLDAVGRTVTGGYDGSSISYVWRNTAAGAPDSPFGTSGVATLQNSVGGASRDLVWATTIDPQGRIVAAGYSAVGSVHYAMVWRLNP